MWRQYFVEYKTRFKVASFVGDVTNAQDVSECLRNTDVVIHTCSYIDVGVNTDDDKMRNINVQGKHLDFSISRKTLF